jgi:hypothetical protein
VAPISPARKPKRKIDIDSRDLLIESRLMFCGSDLNWRLQGESLI